MGDVLAYIDQKCDELKSYLPGPLADTKAEIRKMRPKVMKVQYAQAELRKKVASAQSRILKAIEAEKQKKIEAAEKKACEATLKEVTTIVAELTVEVEKAVP